MLLLSEEDVMKSGRALVAGLAAALAMSAAMALLRVAGIRIDLESMLGSLVIPAAGEMRWTAGFALHLALGALIAWFYAAGFEFAVQRAGILVGSGLGLSHGLLVGLFTSGIADMSPFVSTLHSPPGPFFVHAASHALVGPLAFMLLHVLYGAIVGWLYGDPLQKPNATTGWASDVR